MGPAEVLLLSIVASHTCTVECTSASASIFEIAPKVMECADVQHPPKAQLPLDLLIFILSASLYASSLSSVLLTER